MALSFRKAFKHLLVLSVFFLGLLPLDAAARTISLFNPNGQQSATYDRDINSVQPGDYLTFPGATFQIQKVLGHGNTTVIYDIGGGNALRVPLASGNFRGSTPYVRYLNDYIDGAVELQRVGAPVPKILQSLRNEYIVVEKLQFNFTIGEWLDGRVPMNDGQSQMIGRQLLEFVQHTANLEFVNDLHAGNLAYTNKG